MLPLETLARHQTAHGDEISLDQRGSTIYYRHNQDAILASNALDAGLVMAELVCHPVRSARQPKILITSRGLGELTAGVLNVIIQKRGQIVIHDADPVYAQWQKEYLADLYPEQIDDKRVVSTQTPLPELLESAEDGWHGIVVDLDSLAATNPKALPLFTTARGLAQCAANLREGSLIGVVAAEYDKKLFNLMGDANLKPTTDLLPVTAKARRSKMQKIILAQRGEYISRADNRRG